MGGVLSSSRMLRFCSNVHHKHAAVIKWAEDFVGEKKTTLLKNESYDFGMASWTNIIIRGN